MERLATLSMQRRHRGSGQVNVIRETILDVPGRLNWRMLQVRTSGCEVAQAHDKQDEQLAIYATATIALSHIAFKIDQIHRIVRSLVGEQQFDALEDLSKERARKDAEWIEKA